MSIFKKIFSKEDNSIYKMLKSCTVNGKLNTDKFDELINPVEEGKCKISAGFLDQFGIDEDKRNDQVPKVLKILNKVYNDKMSLKSLEKNLAEVNFKTLNIIDEVRANLSESNYNIKTYETFKKLMYSTNNKEVFKFSLEMTAVIGNCEELLDDYLLIGQYDEFSKYISFILCLWNEKQAFNEALFNLLDESEDWGAINYGEMLMNNKEIMSDLNNQRRILIGTLSNNCIPMEVAFELVSSLNMVELFKITAHDRELSEALVDLYKTLLFDRQPCGGILDTDNSVLSLDTYLRFISENEFEEVKFMALNDMRDFLKDEDNKTEIIEKYDKDIYEELLNAAENLWTSVDLLKSLKSAIKAGDNYLYDVVNYVKDNKITELIPDLEEKYLNESSNASLEELLCEFGSNNVKRVIYKRLKDECSGRVNKKMSYVNLFNKEFTMKERIIHKMYILLWDKAYDCELLNKLIGDYNPEIRSKALEIVDRKYQYLSDDRILQSVKERLSDSPYYIRREAVEVCIKHKLRITENEKTSILDKIVEREGGKDARILEEHKNNLEKITMSDDKKITLKVAGLNLNFDEYLNMLVENKNIDVIPVLFCALVLKNSDMKKKVVKELTDVMRTLSSKKYIYLSKKFRERVLLSYNMDWKNIDMEYLLEDYMSEEERITVLGLASFHPNGFIREKALDELVKYEESKVMHFIIIRSCDWVVDIRKKAQEFLLNLINIRNIKDIIMNRMFIDKIKENIDGLKVYYRYCVPKINIKHEEEYYKQLNYKIESILTDSENSDIVRGAFLECALCSDAYVQQYSLEKLISSNLCCLNEVINILMNVKNQIVTYRCMKLILEKLNDEEVINNKDDLEKVRGYRAQTELIKRLYEAGYFKNIDMLMTYILSKYASVRDIARFYMRKMGFHDYEKIYIENLDNPELKKNALLGLCETCSKENKNIILEYFKDSKSKTQKKIFNRCIELSESEAFSDYNVYLQALQSGNKSVIKLCRLFMKENSELLDKELLYNEYKNETDKYTKDSLAEILCSGSGWTGLLYALRLLEDSYEIANKSVEEWINAKKSYMVKDDKSGGYKYYALSKMNEKSAVEIKSVMDKNAHLLDEGIREIIEGFILYYC